MNSQWSGVAGSALTVCVALVVGLASGKAGGQSADAADDNPVPTTVSAEAQNYLRNLRLPPGRAMNYADPAVMTRLRGGLGKMFLLTARRIRTDYTLDPVDLNGVPGLWVRTPDPVRKGKVLLYLHGGGYILGSPATDLALPLRIGPAAGIAVLSAGYRLAPEHPYPAAVDDALTAYRWLLKQGYRGRDIGVFGDSAGGGLTLALALAVRDARLPSPAALVALSPVTDMTGAGDTRQTLKDSDPILRGDATVRRSAYVGEHDPRDPLISPIYADLRGLPPLLIQVGTREVLLSDSVRFARRAREAGVEVTLDVWEGMWHVFQGNPDVPEAKQASDEIADFLRRRVTGKR
ncbi:MAG: alpha/beta hydrolase [Chromatiales bacterium]|jgi:acetyl esterase/lipase|nr:MAG: alpha/beta hydrolase [Chromatiales bacterium]